MESVDGSGGRQGRAAGRRSAHRIVEVLRVRHYSRRTEQAYVHWIGRFIKFHRQRHPRELSEADVNRTRRTTLVLVTHDQELAAVADVVVALRDGRIVRTTTRAAEEAAS